MRVAIVSRDQAARLQAARAFDAAPASWQVALHEQPPADADVIVVGPDVADVDGIRFDPADPAATLAAVAGRNSRPPIVVCGAGGGVGTTTIALHLAARMARAGSACVVEMRPGIAERLQLPSDALTWERAENPELAALPVRGGFRVVLCPASGAPGAELLERLRQSFDRVVVDVGAVAGALPEGTAVFVFSPTASGVRRAARTLPLLGTPRAAVVANRVGPGGILTRSALERLLGLPVALELPACPALRDADDRGELLELAWSRWLLGIARLERALQHA